MYVVSARVKHFNRIDGAGTDTENKDRGSKNC